MGYEITVLTDHKPLLELFNKPYLSPIRTRWFLTIQDFDPKIKYIQGRHNVVADSLSRNTCGVVNEVAIPCFLTEERSAEVDVEFSKERVQEEQDKDEVLSKAKRFLRGELTDKKYKLPISNLDLHDGLLVRRITMKTRSSPDEEIVQIVVPETLISTVLKLVHDIPTAAHPGAEKTYEMARRKYFWKHMEKSVKEYVKNCHICLAYKGTIPTPSKILEYPIPNRPFQRVHMDLLTNFSETRRRNKHIMVVVDALTRYTVIIPLKSKMANECAMKFYNEFICLYGIPEILVTDNGGEFNNAFLDTLCECFAIKKVNICVYSPSSNGLVERTNRKILEILRTTVGGQSSDWDLSLRAVQLTINTTLHSSIKETPHKALFGFSARMPFDIDVSDVQNVPDPLRTHVENTFFRFDLLREKLKEANVVMQRKQSKIARENKLNVGDTVFLKVNVRNELNYKLGIKFTGPFKIVEKIHECKFRVQNLKDTDDIRVVNINQVKKVQAVEKPKKKVTFNM